MERAIPQFETQHKLLLLETLYDAGLSLGSLPSEDALVEDVLGRAVGVLDASRGYLATFGEAVGAQARLQAFDGGVIGGQGLVEDPDSIRSGRLGLRIRTRQRCSRGQHGRRTEQSMRSPTSVEHDANHRCPLFVPLPAGASP